MNAFRYIIFLLCFCQLSCAQKNGGISVEEFNKEISKPGVIILDVRTPEEYAEGHLVNSVNIDFRDDNFSARIDSLDKSKEYELYCRSGVRSGNSVELMHQKGFKKVDHLQGGIIEWKSKGLPVTK
jgi:rhodanese-related sulfurtransferase